MESAFPEGARGPVARSFQCQIIAIRVGVISQVLYGREKAREFNEKPGSIHLTTTELLVGVRARLEWHQV